MFAAMLLHGKCRAVAGAALLAMLPLASAAQAQNSDTPEPAPAETTDAAPAGSVGGMGDVNLFPKRVVIDGRRSIATVGLYNKVTDPGEYEIQILDMAMTPDGQLVNFSNTDDEELKARVHTASAMLRYSPRRVMLRGNESQTIRIMARADNETPPGEYRSHFLVLSVPTANEGLSIDEATGTAPGDGIGVTIRPRFGISIPVIVRIGDTTLDVGLNNIQMVAGPQGQHMLGITVTRSGTRSAFGDITVTTDGSASPVAIARGIGVYPEVSERKVLVPIDAETDPRFLSPGTKYTVTFTDDDAEPGKVLAEQTFIVP